MKQLLFVFLLSLPLLATGQVDSTTITLPVPVLVDSATVTAIQVVDTVAVTKQGGAMSEATEQTFNWISFFIFVGALVASVALKKLSNLTDWQTSVVGIGLGISMFILDLNTAGSITSMTPAQIWQALTVALVGIITKNIK